MPVSIRQIDNADKLPPERAPAGRSAPWARGALDPSVILFGGVFVLLLCLLVVPLWSWLYGESVRSWFVYGDGAWISRILIGMGLIWIFGRVARSLMFIRVDGRPLPTRSMMRVDAQNVIAGEQTIHATYAGAVVPAQITYSPTIQPAKELPALAAPQEVITGPALLPPHEWLPWFDRRPHGLLAAETGGGKSTTFKAILKSRIERGELVFLLDPHSSDWFGLPGIGGGEDWDAVWSGMRVIISEYRTRLQARDAYLRQHHAEMPVDAFKRITILLDEANTACKELNVARRGETSRWAQFAQTLGSGARKVNLSIILLAQSPNVEDLDMSGPMRNNFTRIALDSRTTRMMVQAEETDPQRKKDLLASLVGQEYPATAIRNGQVVLLDRTGLDMVGTPHNPETALWTEGYEQAERLIGGRVLPPQPVVARPAVAQQQRSETARASVSIGDLLAQPVAPVVPAVDKARLYLKAMAAAGKSREYARQRLEAMGLEFANSKWTEVRKELGLE